MLQSLFGLTTKFQERQKKIVLLACNEVKLDKEWLVQTQVRDIMPTQESETHT